MGGREGRPRPLGRPSRLRRSHRTGRSQPLLTLQVSTRGRSRPMTVAAGHVSTERTAPIPLPEGMPEPAKVPRLADGIELLGEYQGSGYSQPPSLVRRPDGQVIQMSPLLYQVTCRIDGSRRP